MEKIQRSARGWVAGLILLWAAALPIPSQAQFNLPESTVDFTLFWNEVSNSDVVLSGVPEGHDVSNETYLGWCVEMAVDVELEVLFEGRLFNLNEAPTEFGGIDWNRILYILNHKQGGRGDVQLAIWFFTDENNDLSPAAMAMVQAAIDEGANYVPQPGDIGAVLLLPANANIQVMIIEVPVPEHDGGGGPGGGSGGEDCPAPPRTIGYWKNHAAHLEEVLQLGSIDLGDFVVSTPSQAVAVLRNANAKDARNMLRAQLLGTLLNLQNGSAPEGCGVNIEDVVAEAVALLDEISTPISEGHPERERALALKDLLDCFNNSGHGMPDCPENPSPGDGGNGGGGGGNDNGGGGNDNGGGGNDNGGGDNGNGGGSPGGGGDDCPAPPRTIGYWKNHSTHLEQVLQSGSIDLGDLVVSTPSEGVAVLRNASAHDARDMLRAQLLATLLNLRNGSAPEACGVNIQDVVVEAVALLDEITTPIHETHPERERALALKDLLDCFNNSGQGMPDCPENPSPGEGGGNGGDGQGNEGDDDNDGDQGENEKCEGGSHVSDCHCPPGSRNVDSYRGGKVNGKNVGDYLKKMAEKYNKRR